MRIPPRVVTVCNEEPGEAGLSPIQKKTFREWGSERLNVRVLTELSPTSPAPCGTPDAHGTTCTSYTVLTASPRSTDF